jgi:hypothetical protein
MKFLCVHAACIGHHHVSISVNDEPELTGANKKAVHLGMHGHKASRVSLLYQRKKHLCRPKTVAFTHCRQA